ncbi:MAG: PilT/PilU family type 4a pilus ATPase [Oscillospiraceae bacterium]
MEIIDIFKGAVDAKASDIILISNLPISYKIGGKITPISDVLLHPHDTHTLIEAMCSMATDKTKFDELLTGGDCDFSLSISNIGRFRVNAYRQRGTLASVIRTVMFDLPRPQTLGIPSSVIDTGKLTKGLVLVTGAAGCGKSTTLACIVDAINETRNCHIITLEDPVEFIHKHKKSIVSQREVFSDTRSYDIALRASLRQSPDVILLGEMRDFETIRTAMTAAETGQLLLSSLHTNSVAKTINRIIDVFPSEQQQQIRLQLSLVLKVVVCQQLLPSVSGMLVPAFEIMHVTPAIANMIRDSKINQIAAELHQNRDNGMITMRDSIEDLYSAQKITRETADMFIDLG